MQLTKLLIAGGAIVLDKFDWVAGGLVLGTFVSCFFGIFFSDLGFLGLAVTFANGLRNLGLLGICEQPLQLDG